MLAPSCTHKPAMGLVTGANNLNQCGVKLKGQEVKVNLHLQTPPNLWYVGYQSSLTIKEYEHRPLGAHRRVSSVITPTSPPQYPITI